MAVEQFLNKTLVGNICITLDGARKWTADKGELINHIKRITSDYAEQRYKLSLRQLYYQLVAAELIPNHDKVYKKLSTILDDCRYAGLIDWYTIEDRGREPKQAYYENSVEGAMQRTINSYKLDRQLNQPTHIEVWTEKDAISGILSRAVNPYTIIMAINKGYTSSTAIYGAYERFVELLNNRKKVVILYFGDHDPSGLDMIRDIRERLTLMFHNGDQLNEDEVQEWNENADQDYDNPKLAYINAHFEVRPIGLTMEQIKQYKPPHNPAKITDPRAKWYIKQYGAKSWEVDALKPPVMVSIVEGAVKEIMDNDAYEKVLKDEKNDKKQLEKATALASAEIGEVLSQFPVKEIIENLDTDDVLNVIKVYDVKERFNLVEEKELEAANNEITHLSGHVQRLEKDVKTLKQDIEKKTKELAIAKKAKRKPNK